MTIYQRKQHLPWIMATEGLDLNDNSPESRRYIIKSIERAISKEGERGAAGSWLYDQRRHIALSQALQAEQEAA